MSKTQEPVFGGGLIVNHKDISDQEVIDTIKEMVLGEFATLESVVKYKNTKVAHFTTKEGEEFKVPLKDEDADWFEKVATKLLQVKSLTTLGKKIGAKKMKEYVFPFLELHYHYFLLTHLVESGEKFGDDEGEYLMGCNCCKKFYETFGEPKKIEELINSFVFTIGKIEEKTDEEIMKMTNVYFGIFLAKYKNGDFQGKGTIDTIITLTKKLSEIFVWNEGSWGVRTCCIGEAIMPFEVHRTLKQE